MAEMQDFGKMDLSDRGGTHDFEYGDHRNVAASEGLTPSQTVGPFFAYGLTPGAYGYPLRDIHRTDLTGPDVMGERIVIEGQVFDGNGVAVHDAIIEIMQADSTGAFVHSPRNDGFTGFGRCGTGANGPQGDTHYRFQTIRPGASVGAASITCIVTMRGLLNHFVTRMYFPADDLDVDPILAQVPEARRQSLVAEETAPGRYRFDIHMQGPKETVFFDL